MLDLSHRPNVLYLASIERMTAARRMVDDKPHDYVLASYLAGLAVETILQALALHGGAAHDARHSLSNWLSKCPSSLHEADWNLLVARWDNGIRYLSFDGLLGYFRNKGYVHGKKGGVESIVRAVTKDLVDAAEVIHNKGLAVWVSSAKK
jgi:hypothetical protein